MEDLRIVVYCTKENTKSYLPLFSKLEDDPVSSEVEVIFSNKDKIIDYCSTNKKILLAISYATAQVQEIKELITNVRSMLGSKVVIVVGGPHSTGDCISAFSSGVDFVIPFEGEEAFVGLVKVFIERVDPASVKNLLFCVNGKFRYTGRLPHINLDSVKPYSKRYGLYGYIEITRGCPWRCKFCQVPFIFGIYPRHRSIRSIIEAVERYLITGKKDIRFLTPNALMYGSVDGRIPDRVAIESLLKKIKEQMANRGKLFFGSFPSEVRPDYVDEEIISILADYVDNDNLVIGAQSGSERILKLMNRGHTVEDVYTAVDIILKYGFKIKLDLIFGFPGETYEDRKATINMAESLAEYGVKMHLHTFMPLPGTPMCSRKVERVEEDILYRIERLISDGKAEGRWKKQREIAEWNRRF